jgi:hypothetical protein
VKLMAKCEVLEGEVTVRSPKGQQSAEAAKASGRIPAPCGLTTARSYSDRILPPYNASANRTAFCRPTASRIDTMPGWGSVRESEIWSELGYEALIYFLGITSDDLSRLSESEKRRLVGLTIDINRMGPADREGIRKRVEGIPPDQLAAALLQLAEELHRAL